MGDDGSPATAIVRGKRALSKGTGQGRTKSRKFITEPDGVKRPASRSIPRARKRTRPVVAAEADGAEADGAEADDAEADDAEADGAEADGADVEDDGLARELFRP